MKTQRIIIIIVSVVLLAGSLTFWLIFNVASGIKEAKDQMDQIDQSMPEIQRKIDSLQLSMESGGFQSDTASADSMRVIFQNKDGEQVRETNLPLNSSR